MKLPQEWIEEIVNKLKDNKRLFKAFGNYRDIPDSEYYEAVQKYLDMPFNKEWECNPDRIDMFKDFCISIITHQCMSNMHPLTCCSDHEILVPRIDFTGECYLVCPTCGYIQKQSYTPQMF